MLLMDAQVILNISLSKSQIWKEGSRSIERMLRFIRHFSDPCADDPCTPAQNANVTCVSVLATIRRCDYQCFPENFVPIEGDAEKGCTGNFNL